ncbi:MAG: hypothetical protein GY774_35500 [Planctomycetes bacterium]|nr:hypothetical protein [Planctomycetota bacterium]
MNFEEIENRFTYHAPKGSQPGIYELIRNNAKAFALIIDAHCPESREQSLAFTKLEEAIFWANASVARRTE